MLRLTTVRIALGIAAVAILLVPLAGAQEEEKAPPLPFHTIEGYGGGAITPMAYLVNPGPKDSIFGKPAAALSVGNFGDKQLSAITVTETLYDRIELGYGCDRLGLGDLPNDIQRTTTNDVETGDVWLHNFNMRLLLIKESTEPDSIPLPAVTAGVHVKVNNGIASINDNLNGALGTAGYASDTGVDFTLTITKKFMIGEHALFATGGLRESKAAQLGFLGFGDTYRATFEGNLIYMLTDHIVVGYEFRQKADPYSTIASDEPGEFLIGPENSWHAIDVAYILNNHTTFCAGWGNLGNLVNSEANGSWWLQLKYEF
jgi:hypothetical protein